MAAAGTSCGGPDMALLEGVEGSGVVLRTVTPYGVMQRHPPFFRWPAFYAKTGISMGITHYGR